MGKYTTGIHPDVFEEYKEKYREIRQKEKRLTELRNDAYEFNMMGDKISHLYTPDKPDQKTKLAVAGNMYYRARWYKRKVDQLERELKTLRNALKLRFICELKDAKCRCE